jgi:hypothetical protein
MSLTILIAGCIAGSPRTAYAQAGDAAWLLTQINTLRQSKGLNALAYNGVLASAANSHSLYLATNPWSDPHTETNGSTPRSRALAAGYPVKYVGENVVGGPNATPEWAFNWWMNSSIHYQNMLGSAYLEIGIGVADGDQGKYYTLLFGAADGSNPAPQPAAAQPQAPAPDTANQTVSQAVKAPPTRVPTRRPTLTPTNTLTPTITYTPRATFTPTFTTTPPPATVTAIVLEVSPQPTKGAQLVAMISTPQEPDNRTTSSASTNPAPNAPHSNDLLRILIPLALAIQVMVIGGAVARSVLQRRKANSAS